jgi:pimeloyl-ACP methyl ester carboxylesterase
MKQRSFKANGIALSCLDYGGEGNPPILFLHGGSANAHWWDFVAPAFVDRFHALALDQRGHGDSESPPDWAYGTRHYVSDLDEIIGSWGLGVPVMVGHSMGGHNTLVYAAHRPERLRAMVAIDTPPDYTERAVEFLRSMAARPPRRFPSLADACANFRLLPRETTAPAEILAHVARHSFRDTGDGAFIHKIDRRTMIREPLDVWKDLHRITCPALIVKITKSPLLDLEVARRMSAAMPQGRLAQIDDGFHHVMFDNPRALIATLKDFLKDIR